MNQIKFIIFPDGSTMPLSEYRAMCLRDAKTIADHGDLMFRLGSANAFMFASLSIALSYGSCVGIPELARIIFIFVAAACIPEALWFRSQAAIKSAECLQRRQWIMDSLHAAEKAFA